MRQVLTGVRDMAGTEIREGDILSFATNYDRRRIGQNGEIIEKKIDNVVTFSNGSFRVDGLPLTGGNFFMITIIGSIYNLNNKEVTND